MPLSRFRTEIIINIFIKNIFPENQNQSDLVQGLGIWNILFSSYLGESTINIQNKNFLLNY